MPDTMKRPIYLAMLGIIIMITGCKPSETAPEPLLTLGSMAKCKLYSGLPQHWLKQPHAGMVWLESGMLHLGSQLGYPDEVNFGEKQRQIAGFWIDQTEVTVAQFQSFIHATGYITDAEQQNQAAVFSPDPKHPTTWWQLKSGYTWKTPHGIHGTPALPNEPVRYVTKNDAEHYASWLGRDLPSELEWEYAAKAGQHNDTPLHQAPKDQQQHPQANYWQGDFPFHNSKDDHFLDVAPVGCFTANAFSLYDMIGNVWELTSSTYRGPHDMHMGQYDNLRATQRSNPKFVIKGGSYLCAENYCARYRNSSRHPHEADLAISHVGFRTIMKP